MFTYTGKTIFMGIDVHKNTYSVSVICDNVLIKRDTLAAIPANLLTYCEKYKGARIRSAYEAGFCGFYLHRILVSHNIDNIVVHAASIEIGSRDCVKTDKRDSLKIATQLAAGRLSCVYIPSESQEDERFITRLREQYVKNRRRVACQIKSLLHLRGVIKPNTRPIVGEKWFKLVSQAILSRECLFTFWKLVETWRHLNAQLSMINKEIAIRAKEHVWLLDIYESAPGIGHTNALKLMNELHDMSQFSNEGKLAGYAGLTPREYSSGEHVRQGHITRHGKSIIRGVLVEAAWMAIRKDIELNTKFEKLSRRAGKKRAIVAIARILLLRIRTCIKEKRPYEIKKAQEIPCPSDTEIPNDILKPKNQGKRIELGAPPHKR